MHAHDLALAACAANSRLLRALICRVCAHRLEVFGSGERAHASSRDRDRDREPLTPHKNLNHARSLPVVDDPDANDVFAAAEAAAATVRP